MTGTARGSGGGMEAEKGGAAAGLGFLGMDRMRLLLPLPLPEKVLARTVRSHIFSYYLGFFKVWMCWRWLLLSWLLLWLFISSYMLHYMSSQAVEKRREALASMCDERARMLQDQFNVSMNHLQALAILVSTFHHSKTPSAIDQVIKSSQSEPNSVPPTSSCVPRRIDLIHLLAWQQSCRCRRRSRGTRRGRPSSGRSRAAWRTPSR
jgi:arabidopsis histidine kinase 2/3/4 (cytokinin receptor)